MWQCCPHIETSGFYMRATLAINGLIKNLKKKKLKIIFNKNLHHRFQTPQNWIQLQKLNALTPESYIPRKKNQISTTFEKFDEDSSSLTSVITDITMTEFKNITVAKTAWWKKNSYLCWLCIQHNTVFEIWQHSICSGFNQQSSLLILLATQSPLFWLWNNSQKGLTLQYSIYA